MMAFLMAATMAAAAALPATAAPAELAPTVTFKILGPKPAEACAALIEKTAKAGDIPFKRLDELPRGITILAVLRTVGGCPVIEVRYQGRNVWLAPSVPTLQPITPLPLTGKGVN